MGRRTREHGQKGAAMVEFAIVLPLLLVLVFGIIEFGLLLYNQQVITNASREGARYGIVSRTPRRTVGEIQGVVNNYTGSHLVTFGTGTPTTSIVPNATAGAVFGDDLTVTVRYQYDFLVMPNFILALVGGKELQAVTMMKYE